MNAWAASGKYDCHFLCICVLGDRGAVSLSKEMGSEMQLTHCVNGFIDNEQDQPLYGQLGCRGFIVMDHNHNVVTTATAPFMEVRQLAFSNVEAILDAVCARKPVPSIIPGEYVRFVDAPPNLPELKNQEGMCHEIGDDGSALVALLQGRFRGKGLRVPLNWLRGLDDPEESSGGGSCQNAGGCGSQGSGAGGCGTGGSCGTGGGCATRGDCGAGGCDAAGAMDTDDDKRELLTAAETINNLVSVKVASMDDEHEECAKVLRRLVVEQSKNSLQAVLLCLTEHFAHEEALFEKFSWGGKAGDSLSARSTHIQDHARLLAKLQRELAQGPERVPAGFVKELLEDFHAHTSRYDLQYAETLCSQGAV
eukprot:gnl/TRDRNA2_/TRDRNA2_157649_c0_seq1.p1 gnl/TRDRNA2_/TRDRNA2_157649_c0~~gnl/TRDRNA2_/TRDRNA2_157649_c0_seq1.p1  ORF type:complete len:365 (-),score=67.59 gnl/TRDRNA2_/TRDRNA2_157649_c0_seq1:43-1137(-)